MSFNKILLSINNEDNIEDLDNIEHLDNNNNNNNINIIQTSIDYIYNEEQLDKSILKPSISSKNQENTETLSKSSLYEDIKPVKTPKKSRTESIIINQINKYFDLNNINTKTIEYPSKYFIIESKGGKDILNYKTYSICYITNDYNSEYINDYNDYIITCNERRYLEFLNLRTSFSFLYPHILLPTLPPKDILQKLKTNISIFSSESMFYHNRKQRLEYFLQFISEIDEINDSILFEKFVNDETFSFYDFNIEEYIKNNDPKTLQLQENKKEVRITRPIIRKERNVSGGFFDYLRIDLFKARSSLVFERNEKNLLEIQGLKTKIKEIHKDLTEILHRFRVYEECVNEEVKQCSHEDVFTYQYIKTVFSFKGNEQDENRKYIQLCQQSNDLLSKLISIVENVISNIEGFFDMIFLYDTYVNDCIHSIESFSSSITVNKTMIVNELKEEYGKYMTFFEKRVLSEGSLVFDRSIKEFSYILNAFCLFIKKFSG